MKTVIYMKTIMIGLEPSSDILIFDFVISGNVDFYLGENLLN